MTYELPQLLPHCKQPKKQFCESCRDLERGRTFRRGVLERQGIEGVHVDFECIKGLPWGYKRTPVAVKKITNITVNVGKVPPPKKFPVGPGGILHRLLVEKYQVPACQSCAEMVKLMNNLGPEGCRQNKKAIIDDMWTRRHQLKGWKAFAVKLPTSAFFAKRELGKLFDKAVSRAEEELAKHAKAETDTDA